MTNETVEEIVEIEESVVDTAKGLVSDAQKQAHKAFSASLGAIMWVNDNVTEMVTEYRGKTEKQVEDVRESADSLAGKMIERGTNFQTDARSRIDEVLQTRRSELNERTDALLSKADGTIETLLGRFNLPTKDSIDDLNKKLTSLGRKVDQVRKQTESMAG